MFVRKGILLGRQVLIAACLNGLAACSGSDLDASEKTVDIPRPVASTSFSDLRIRGWRLLEPFTLKSSGLPDPGVWTPSDVVLSEPKPKANFADDPLVGIRRATEHTGPEQGAEPTLYEMTFFNPIARRFIEENLLNTKATTYRLLDEQIREIQFPKGSAATKTFWYVLKHNRSVNVRVWDWTETTPRDPSNPTLDASRLRPQCVAEAASNECISADQHFYTVRVDDPKRFTCLESDCLPLDEGDLLILVGMHIASKERPEWLWATYWWQGDNAPGGADWTCADAQRTEAIGALGLPWRNYAMNVTASFRREKPALDARNRCGVPQAIEGKQEYLATYNPFVEARVMNGLKSSCIDCHSRASTDQTKPDDVPPIGVTGGPALKDFERHIRVDYMWSLWRSLGKTPILGAP